METEIKHKINQMRTDMGMTQAALGELLGTNRDDIKDIECGRKRCIADKYLKIVELHERWKQKQLAA